MKAHTITKRFLGFLVSILLLAACKDAGNNNPEPQITAIQPESGPPGTAVTITGTGFSPEATENTVRFGSTAAAVNSASESRITTQVPEDTQTGAVSVTVGNVTVTGPNFTVEPKAPGISTVEPDSGTVGRQVTITGMNFSAVPTENTVTFNGAAAQIGSASETELITEVPEGATDGPIVVTVSQKSTSGPDFNVITSGAVEVTTITSGPDPDDFDVDGYVVNVDGANGPSAVTTGKTIISNLEEGLHELLLTGVSSTCAVTNDNPQPVTITAGDTTAVTFQVSCRLIANNQMAFHSSRAGGNVDIYLMNADGSGVQRLTDHHAFDQFPAISRDGTKIAFLSNRNGGFYDIYTMNVDGSDLQQITSTDDIEFSVNWSPDSSKLVYEYFSLSDNKAEIYTINADGTGMTPLTRNSFNDGDPSWSPKRDRIAFVSDRDGAFNIYMMNPDGTDVQQITTEKTDDILPQWSPDGSKLAFVSERDDNFNIYTINSDGTDVQRITNSPASDLNPSWSPDGSKIIFDTSRNGNRDIYIIEADGRSEAKNITPGNSSDDASPYWSPVE